MKILIAGGAGFIGSHLCDRLIKENYDVICVDNFLTGSKENIKHLLNSPHFKLITQDVINPLKLTEKIDAIFHLASPASPNHHSKISYFAHPMKTMMVNTQGTLQLLKLAKRTRAKFLFASTSEVYGEPLEHPQKEDYRGNVSTTGLRSIYDEAKRFGETLTAYFFRQESTDTRIARIFNTYGSRMLKADMRMIITFINQATAKKNITIFGDGSQTRSLCYIDDMVDGLLRLMFYPKTKGEIINLGSTDEHTVKEYAFIVKKLTKSKSKIVYSEKLPVDDPKKRRPDIAKAKRLLGWKPKVDLKQGLINMIEFYNK
ncbi:NAD-dependent dehydratase [Candidatus Roizmanbacteria bacterium RIFCSPLOWO2_01_FULL_37_12]|uniref:NAD-dependent dehydratase n=1 Tax=Candidatus Roizmanbacteria bacterium RIFCSPLOWO2_01_FULL_37_12 TaxID=1802056 RepID=A0A1F7IBQ3_9BACT|nr:MAG: NAD-dependent dehydratase [Candidatus Roizmanbacteria bacterium RIFCSPHIGHO2_01_FULL_37_16]OGK24932.1 MAG: NAD-dependent dehydratase [Candidatus Roizmanbacteria bacterium RIFCSPHIGHO2_02_FULL_37_9b]OGK40785.1 MAG: NAD-dependent dehydratase [Candidatus Roizmanbacteria bacterium RIFCSPLOWO2_01_FULL_37_12]